MLSMYVKYDHNMNQARIVLGLSARSCFVTVRIPLDRNPREFQNLLWRVRNLAQLLRCPMRSLRVNKSAVSNEERFRSKCEMSHSSIHYLRA